MAMSRFQRPTQSLCLAVLFLAGCRQQADTPPAPAPTPMLSSPRKLASPEILGYTVEDLSVIGSYLPALDEACLQVAPPAEWHVAPRSKNYVVRFLFDRNRRLELPRITVKVSAAQEEDPRNLSKKNLVSYIQSMKKRMDEKKLQAMDGEIEPLVLGAVPCARYVVRKKFRRGEKNVSGECEVVQTIRAGRVYTVFLDVYAGTLVRYRADAYAVMATAKFLSTADPDEADPDEADPDEADSDEADPPALDESP